MEDFIILNYQGRKNNLGNFIIENIKPYIKEDKAIFDISQALLLLAICPEKNSRFPLIILK
jgi:hypothetical protein